MCEHIQTVAYVDLTYKTVLVIVHETVNGLCDDGDINLYSHFVSPFLGNGSIYNNYVYLPLSCKLIIRNIMTTLQKITKSSFCFS